MGFDWFTFVAQIVNFVVLVGLLNHFLYGPITQAMKSREQSIADRLTGAELRERQADLELQKYNSLNDDIARQRTLLLEQATSDSDAARKKLMTEARNEVQFRREDWLESLHRDQDSLVKSIRQHANQQIVQISSQALTQLADTEIEHRSFEQFLNQLKETSADDRQRLQRESIAGDKAHVHSAFAISKPWQTKIKTALRDELGLEDVVFMATPNLVLGIELHLGGSKIGWSAQEYLETLSDELEMMLEKQPS